MKKIRSLPFGYKIEEGEITIYEQEASLVRLIFEEYKNGASLNSIADILNPTGIPYNEGTSIWNKSHIKRILDNYKYTGEDCFPILVDCADYNAVQRMKDEKNNRKNVTPLSSDIEIIRKHTYCRNCGSQYTRWQNGNRDERWLCKNKVCRGEASLADEKIKAAATSLLNQIIDNPDIIQITSNIEVPLEIMKKRNDFRRELNKTDINADYARSLLYDIAAEQYRLCRKNDPTPTVMLHSVFENAAPQSDLDCELFSQSVEKIWIDTDGSILLQLINGQVIS